MQVSNACSSLIGIFTLLMSSNLMSSHSNGNQGEYLITPSEGCEFQSQSHLIQK